MKQGERIDGRYKIKKIIGQGGMAKVYLAKDLILDRDVAVKMMSYDFQNDEGSMRRFNREALSTTELVHPNIVNIYDVGEDENPYIVMEYVDGTDLKQYIHDHHPIAYKKSLAIMNQVLEAVEYAHQNGIIHRDLKPQNILIDNEGNVKITDFGIAVALSQNSITQTNSLLGSVHYLSPEQARGSLVTKQSDVYALGILLYELLTGDVPFDGESPVSIALKHFQNDLPSLRQIDHRIPQPLENVVLRATAKESNQRYESVAEMNEDLRTSLSPERSGEPKFVPKDPNDEDTRVIEPVKDPSKNNSDKDHSKTIVAGTTMEENEPVIEKPKKKRPWWILIILLLIGLVTGITILILSSRPSEVQIPEELVGMEYEDAVALLDELNLIIGTEDEEYSDEYAEGIIINTSPSGGSTVREGAEVDWTISLGVELYVIEDYIGDEFVDVEAELTDLDFTVEMIEESSNEFEEGLIMEQSIDSGEEVIPAETTITFTVSNGSNTYQLEDYTGETYEAIASELTELGFTVNREDENSDEVEEGLILNQSLNAGNEVVPDETTIIFTVSSGEAGVELTDFTGQTETAVQIYASNNNLNVTIEEESSDTAPSGTVFSQNPDPGTLMYSGDSFTVTVSTGPEEPEDPETESFSVDVDVDYVFDEETDPEGEIPNNVEIYIDDFNYDMNTAVETYEIESNVTITISFVVEEGDSASYRIVRDGQIIEEETVNP